MATLAEYRDRPHWSFSSLNQFVNICSLQWAFQRLYRVPAAFTPVTLSFGSAFHRTLEWMNLSRKEGKRVSRHEAGDLFATVWTRQLQDDRDIRFDEDQTPGDCCRQGQEMIGCLVDSLDPGESVLTVNEAFAVPLVDAWGQSLETPLIGEIDTVTLTQGRKALVDWKTSGKRWAKGKADLDLQPTAFLYGYRHLHGEVPEFRFDVVVKNKAPVVERHVTARTQDQFNRMVELVKRVEAMVAAEHFLPNEQSFYCSGCPYATACKTWHRQKARVISAGGGFRKAA